LFCFGDRLIVGTARIVGLHGANFAAVAGDIDRLLHGAQQRGLRRANAGSATLSAYVVAGHKLVLFLF